MEASTQTDKENLARYRKEAQGILGSNYRFIKDHKPTRNERRDVNVSNLLIDNGFIYEDNEWFSTTWEPVSLSVKDRVPTVQQKCSEMEIRKLNDILNDLHLLNPKMCEIFTKQLTVNYSSESEYWENQKQWNAWIRLLIKDYLPPCGQPDPRTFKFSLNKEKLEILMKQPLEITFLPKDHELLSSLTTSRHFVAYNERFCKNKQEMQLVISSMNLRDFRQLVNIIYHIGLYESFKKIITNCETISDYNNFGDKLIKFLANFLPSPYELEKNNMHLRDRLNLSSCYEVFNFVKRHPGFLIIMFVFVMFYLLSYKLI
jgi:hypothetical protein